MILKFFSTLFFLLLFALTPVKSQTQEGTIRYLITHDWAKKMAAVTYISQQTRDRETYMAGNRWQWKEYANFYFTPTESKYEESEERANADDEGYSWRRETFFIKRNYEKSTQYDVMTMLGKVYIVEDSIHAPNWKIHNDLKEVAGHLCMKAYWEDTVKMQKITAWFALDMPLSGGPERLCGLPGLILEADVNSGAMLITADRIDLKKLTTELDLPKKVKGKKITEADYQAILKKHYGEKRKAEQVPYWGIRY